MSREPDYGLVHGHFVTETEKAILINFGDLPPNENKIWLPRGLCKRITKSPDRKVEIEVEAWWIEEKGLEDES